MFSTVGGVQRGGCSVPWMVFSTMADILSTLDDVQYHGGYLEYRGGQTEYREGCSVPLGYLEYRRGCSILWRAKLSIVEGYLEYRGGYHDTCGDIISTMGDIQYPYFHIQYHGEI